MQRFKTVEQAHRDFRKQTAGLSLIFIPWILIEQGGGRLTRRCALATDIIHATAGSSRLSGTR